MITIAIIGSGFSGTITAINLFRHATAFETPIKVLLIGPHDSFGKGLAYATEDDNLVLNVPIGNMSAFADKPDDFLNFCTSMDSSLISGAFVFRRIYGEYLKTRLDEIRSDNAINLVEIQDIVVDIRKNFHGFILKMQTGIAIESDIVVLAFGHFQPRPLSEVLGGNVFGSDINHESFLDNPWNIRALDRLPFDRDVLIVGTGHTAIDSLFRLVSCPSARKIYLISRHGHIPNGHRKAGEFVKIPSLATKVEKTVRNLLADTPTIRTLLSAIRKLAEQHVALGGNWRDVINSLRQITPEIWRKLPSAERARFLRHVVYHWDVLRHRLAPVAIRRLESLITSGRVEIVAGRIKKLKSISESQDLYATIKLRESDDLRELRIGSIINCSGPNYDIYRIDSPLIKQLVEAGLLRQDEAKIGFSVDENYRCSDAQNLYYIGPMLKAQYWEAIAVPELRMHAQKLSKILLVNHCEDEF
jgi:uncharacterized NAD(P)/FAD-binding protein YdhS